MPQQSEQQLAIRIPSTLMARVEAAIAAADTSKRAWIIAAVEAALKVQGEEQGIGAHE